MGSLGWDDAARPRCPQAGATCRVVRTPAGNYWCDYHLVAFKGEEHATEPLFVADYFTCYRWWTLRHLRAAAGADTPFGLEGEDSGWDDGTGYEDWWLLGGASTVYVPQQRLEGVCPMGKVAPCTNPCMSHGHGCGIYGTTDFRLEEYIATGTRTTGTTYQVYGQVGLWGRTWQHATGMRAQYAYPLCFYPPPAVHLGFASDHAYDHLAAISAAALRYGVPVEEPVYV